MIRKKHKTDEDDFEALDRLAHSITPRKLQRVDAYAKAAGLSRSQLFADAVRERIDARR
jgi:metal-responsive CopG/Arc/MetJ family transcriptional regulator